jgi:hypothetical protein
LSLGLTVLFVVGFFVVDFAFGFGFAGVGVVFCRSTYCG